MARASVLSTSSPVGKPAVNPWFIAIAVMLATFMEVLDTSIANVALNHIAGNLSASTDEATWVLTSYLVQTRWCFQLRAGSGVFLVGKGSSLSASGFSPSRPLFAAGLQVSAC